ncbi:BTAD domain-containing putative transcriptional regulator [Sphaerisporangium rubeum]|uniref:DNA-binding SARP family transcriptional activator/tetratricopeptide (TPR) repeat protein n=1 Tax=Sphaerisporangium rubeum TaxID=321317 RepID=A0A7X0M9W1_9ACTN|nr:AfsR/SARP family transcriptional regulator [Sphaerisporangium rubeum]MBB6475356.1 DNA-binding SARP family transcriptional activator/tetratricopeptide (TPR) repeat protein [Sphaerisporangium rubeum]
MEFRLLGPVEVWNGGRQARLGGAKPRALLTALLLEAGRVVAVERLIEAVWGSYFPATARAVVQTYVASLRRSLEEVGVTGVIVSHRAGYVAQVPVEAIDLRVFERLVAEGRRDVVEARHAEGRDRLRAALGLWRGAALGGIGDSFLRAEAARLEELRLTVVEERVAADLALGEEERLLDELAALVAAYPARERLRRDLMVALYRADRQADALAVYREGRRVLVEELGVEPGVELRQAHEAILRSDPALPGPPRGRGPRQLPPPPPDFVGRQDEVASLRTALTRPDAMPICVVSGAGGMGKSALALRVAHEVAGDFPDGQLYVDLRGTSDAPAGPEEVLGRVLRELDPGTARPPATLEERAGRYRTLMAGRRKLVVLEDAATEAQVRPLLPGGSGCAVLITSRYRLVGLAGAVFAELGVLPHDTAMELFIRIAGPERVAAERGAADGIVGLCGGLPLAVRIAGARLASRRRWPLARLLGRLDDEKRRLDELTVGDQQVRAGMSLSYALLPSAARTALRRLGLLGLPSFPAWVAASALDTDLDEAERVLEHLVDVSLVDVEGVDPAGQLRYRMHDLIRLFAKERAVVEDGAAERNAVVARVLGGWIWLVERVDEAAPPYLISVPASYRLACPVDERVAAQVVAAPRVWFRVEQEALIAGVELAAGAGLDELAVELTTALSCTVFGGHQYVFDDPFASWRRTHEAALSAVRRMENAHGEATLLAGLGQLHYERDMFAESRAYLSQALSMFRAAKDVRGEGATLASLGAACREQGYLPEALHFLDRARELLTGLGDASALGHVRRLAGTVRLETGEYPAAWDDLRDALALFTAAGSRRGRGLTLRSMSLYHRARGEWTAAEELARRALGIFQAADDRMMEAYCVRALAKALLRQGRFEEAGPPLRESLTVLRTLHDSFGVACTLRTLGELHLAEGRFLRAGERLEESLLIWERLGAALFRARTLRDLAEVHESLGDAAAAARARTAAVETFRSHGSREYGEMTL